MMGLNLQDVFKKKEQPETAPRQMHDWRSARFADMAGWAFAVLAVAAGIVEAWFLALFVIKSTGDFDWRFAWAVGNEIAKPSFKWSAQLSLHVLLFAGLLAASAVIIVLSTIWLPAQMMLRGFGRWTRGSLIAVGIGCNAIIIGGGVIAQIENRKAGIRDHQAVEQLGEQARSGLVVTRDRLITDLEKLRTGNSVEAMAARAGSEAWKVRIQLAEQSQAPNLEIIRRNLSAAIAAEQLQSKIDAQQEKIDAAPPPATTAVTVEDEHGKALEGFAGWFGAMRPVLISLALSAIGILATLWSMAAFAAATALKQKDGGDAQTQQTNPAPSNKQDAEDQPEAANSNNASAQGDVGGGEAQAQSAAKTSQVVEDDIFVTGHRRRRTKQRRLRPATLEELRAAGLIMEPEDEAEAVNDRDGTEGTEADRPMDESRLDESAAGSGDDHTGDLGDRDDPEIPVLDDEPKTEDMPEETNRNEQGTKNQEGTETQSVQTEEEAAA